MKNRFFKYFNHTYIKVLHKTLKVLHKSLHKRLKYFHKLSIHYFSTNEKHLLVEGSFGGVRGVALFFFNPLSRIRTENQKYSESKNSEENTDSIQNFIPIVR